MPRRPDAAVSRAGRWSRAGALLAGAALAVAISLPVVLHGLRADLGHRLVDLEVYQEAGQQILVGGPVYSHLTDLPQLLPFTYPPFSALLAIPFAEVPPPVMRWLWTAFQLLALAGVVRIAGRALIDRAGRAAPLAWGVLTGAGMWVLPMRDGIRYGQVDVFLALLCLADLGLPATRWARGRLVGLATAVKLTPGVFVLHLFFSRQRATARRALVAAVGLSLLPFLVIPRDAMDFWTRALFESDRLGANASTENQSLRGVVLRLGPHGPLGSVVWLALAVAVGWYGFRLGARAVRAGEHLTATVAVGLLAVLLSPVAWIHHLVWVVAVALVLARDGRDPVRVVVAFGTWLWFVVPLPWFGFSLVHHAGLAYAAGRVLQQSYAVGAVLALVVLSWSLRRTPAVRAVPPGGALDLPGRPAVRTG